MNIRADAAELGPDLIALRRELHQIPEIGLHLPRTQERVLTALEGLPLEISLGTGLSSITGVLRGGRPGPVVLLRGDMDALPIVERTGADFTSKHEGVMHACGHDLHTAGLVGAARLLCAHRTELAGDVVFMFQPGEEGFDGASHMIREGVLTAAGRKADVAYGLHVLSSLVPAHVFTGRPGPLMAASDGLFVRVVGAGAHGSRPHSGLDPIPVACEMVTALQTMVTRRFDVFDPVVITVGVFHAGTRRNIIPDDATFDATVRSFSPKARDRIRTEAVQLCEDIATEHQFVADTVQDLFGDEGFQPLENPVTGAEDFSRVLNEVPGAYVFLGATGYPDPETAPGNHSPLAKFDDAVVPDGAALLAELAARRLR
jgi:hippurate hydrolase